MRLRLARERTPLPGQVPPGDAEYLWQMLGQAVPKREDRLAAPPPLKLTRDGRFFTIDAPIPLKGPPSEHLLARWWVSGKPVVAGPGVRMQMDKRLEPAPAKRIRITFGVPDFGPDRPVKPGDRVGLQVLYSPMGFTLVQPSRGRPSEVAVEKREHTLQRELPLLSNRLDFIVSVE